MIDITCFWPFGAISGPFGLFWIISEKTWFFASKTQSASWPKWFVAKNQVLSEMIQKSPKGPKMAPNGQKHVILIILCPFQVMTVIQLWHHLIQIIWVIQLNNNTMIISWVARGSLPRWLRGGTRQAKLTPDCALNFQSFRSSVLPKTLCRLNFESRVAKQFAQMRQMRPREAKLTPKFTAFLCVTVLHKPQTRRQNLFLFRREIFCDVFFLPILVAYDKGKNL